MNWALERTGTPSASVAIVMNGQVAFANAFGAARLTPATHADAGMRYAIGSVSKQFTAAAILLLVEDGKLNLSDPVSKFMPDLTQSNEVTIRMLLSHTSGYSDYWPQDYVMTDMMLPTRPIDIIAKWAKRPLDFSPGTKWQYSNTNYVIAGRIVEQLSNQQLFAFLSARIFEPLAMSSVYDVNERALPSTDPAGYYRHALGPLRLAPKEGRGWLFAAGELSMTASDLAKWDISLINRSLLKPESYNEMFKEVKLKDGTGTSYGLGVDVHQRKGHQYIEHSGEVSGFTSKNTVILDRKAAVVALANEDAVTTPVIIAASLAPSLAGQSAGESRALQLLKQLQANQLDRTQLTPFCSAYFTEEALRDFSTSLRPLGEPLFLTEQFTTQRGGMTYRGFRVQFPDRALTLSTYEMPDGKLEQFLVAPSPP
ncbi:MAG: serine hydrolase [Acidobacteriaceae bacterium]|nr:serine hydrolase [Acidobacteriaceae bacterium]